MTSTNDNEAGKPVAYLLSKSSRCYRCDKKLEKGNVAQLINASEDREVLCAQCAEIDNLEILPKGNAKLTRLASKYSKTKYSLLQWSELWKTYERQGVLLEPEAIKQARANLLLSHSLPSTGFKLVVLEIFFVSAWKINNALFRERDHSRGNVGYQIAIV